MTCCTKLPSGFSHFTEQSKYSSVKEIRDVVGSLQLSGVQKDIVDH